MTRLETSLRILREINDARLLRKNSLLVTNLEFILKRHDYDCRDKVDTRQLTIFDALPACSQKK